MPASPPLELPLMIAAGGAALVVIGMARRGAAKSFAAAPRADLAGLRPGARVVTSGAAYSPFPLVTPVAKKECVFYIEELSEKAYSAGQLGSAYGHSHMVSAGDNARGAFYIKEGGSEALVVPTFASADINKVYATETNNTYLDTMPAEQRSEKHIAPGETVSVLGTPRPLTEFIRYLRQDADITVPTDMLNELLRLEKEGSSLLCFFGDGVERVSDQPPAEYGERAKSGASALVWLGAAALAAGVLWTLAALLGGTPAALPD